MRVDFPEVYSNCAGLPEISNEIKLISNKGLGESENADHTFEQHKNENSTMNITSKRSDQEGESRIKSTDMEKQCKGNVQTPTSMISPKVVICAMTSAYYLTIGK